jgi:hypothetical protein
LTRQNADETRSIHDRSVDDLHGSRGRELCSGRWRSGRIVNLIASGNLYL